MHLRIDLRKFPPDYKCYCGHLPEYIVRIPNPPERAEMPYVTWACKECLVEVVDTYKEFFEAYETYLEDFEAAMDKLRYIRFEKELKEKENASN